MKAGEWVAGCSENDKPLFKEPPVVNTVRQVAHFVS